MTFANVFFEIAALLGLAAGVAILGQMLRQPLVVSLILAGILAGPAGLDLVRADEHVGLLSEIGVALLLFLVGLKLDLNLVRTLGPVALATGLGQVAFTSLIGFALCLVLGLDAVTSAYVAIALTFSSTIIIVKLLSDKREIDSLHGRIALGFLIVQDIVVIVAMVALSALGLAQGADTGRVLDLLVFGVGLLALVGVFIRYVANPLLHRLAAAPEVLVTFAISWAVILAAVGDGLGFGKELGGLLGGVSLASSRYREAIAARLASLRDFLLIFFFVGLGSRLDVGALGGQSAAAMVLSLFVLVGNPLIVLAIMGAMGYRKRTGFLAGLTVAQISEFSLIFIVMGVTLGHVDQSAVALVTMVGLVTITASTYMIVYSHPLYDVLEPVLRPFERAVPHREDATSDEPEAGRYDVVLFGLGRYGSEIGRILLEQGRRVLGIDFDPEAVARWQRLGHAAVYGDGTDAEFLASLPAVGVRWWVVAVPPQRTSLTHADLGAAVLAAVRALGGRVAVTAHRRIDVDHYLHAGAALVFLPFSDGAERAVERLCATEEA